MTPMHFGHWGLGRDRSGAISPEWAEGGSTRREGGAGRLDLTPLDEARSVGALVVGPAVGRPVRVRTAATFTLTSCDYSAEREERTDGGRRA